MSMIGGGMGAMGASSATRFSATRGRMGGAGTNVVGYPSPFFDVAHTYLPVTVKQMFRWCKYYFLTNPLTNATIFKLSEYPVTDIMVDHEDASIVDLWTNYLQEHLGYRGFQVEVGLDYHTYGNAMVSIGYPFKKHLTCQACRNEQPASKVRANWTVVNYAFRYSCVKCGHVGDAIAQDFYIRNPSGIKLIRWNPEDVEITYNDVTGESTYFYTIPATVRNDILMGKKEIVEDIPQIYIQALKEQKGIVFSKDNFFHLKRPSLATIDRGWGTPLLLPILKDVFYLQLMKKAQEAILLEHIVPLRILFPQAGSGTSDPYTTINLLEWREHVAGEIQRWRWDSNYIPIMPLPLGNQTIGGDGKALLLTGEIQQWSEQIIMGMGVPREFLMGGMSYAGTNVSMRMLENAFIGYIIRHKRMINWVVREVASFLRWPRPSVKFTPFKMADDLQRKAFLLQLNGAGKVSDRTLLADSNLKQEEEDQLMRKETSSRIEALRAQKLAEAELQGEQSLIMAKYQAKATEVQQKAMGQAPGAGEPGGPDALAQGTPGGQEAGPGVPGAPPQDLSAPEDPRQGNPLENAQSPLGLHSRLAPGTAGVDLNAVAYQQAQALSSMPVDQQEIGLRNLEAQSPELADLVRQLLKTMGQPIGMAPPVSLQPSAAQNPVDMRPLPDKLPPRRAGAIV